MAKVMKKEIVLFLFALMYIYLIPLSIVLAQSYNDPYEDRYYDSESDYRDYDRERVRESERRELDLEKQRLDYERRRFDEERQLQQRDPAQLKEQCPNGFSPSENKCTVEERRRGCKDMRLPGGLGCVKR